MGAGAGRHREAEAVAARRGLPVEDVAPAAMLASRAAAERPAAGLKSIACDLLERAEALLALTEGRAGRHPRAPAAAGPAAALGPPGPGPRTPPPGPRPGAASEGCPALGSGVAGRGGPAAGGPGYVSGSGAGLKAMPRRAVSL